MNQIEILSKQTYDAYAWVNKLISAIPYDKWDDIPDVIASNVSWQVGHLILSYYYHSISVIVGHRKEILTSIPLKDYNRLYGYGTNPADAIGETDPASLHSHLNSMEEKSIEVIMSLPEEVLVNDLEVSRHPHPVAKNKFEAIDWNIKHTMWHCGQIGLIKRIVAERHDFGVSL